MECQNASCYISFLCRIKHHRAENCAIHRWYLEGEGVILKEKHKYFENIKLHNRVIKTNKEKKYETNINS